MPKMVLDAAYLSINSVDISSCTKKIQLVAKVSKEDVTTFASNGWREYTGGLKEGSLSFTVFNDLTDDALDEDMWALFLAGDPVAFEVRGDNAAAGASNPKWTGNVLVEEWTPVSGSVGDVNSSDYTYTTSGAVTRGTS